MRQSSSVVRNILIGTILLLLAFTASILLATTPAKAEEPAVPAMVAPMHIDLTIPPLSWKEFRRSDEDAGSIPSKQTRKDEREGTVGELQKDYVYLDGLPIERDVALLFESGELSSFYNAVTTRLLIGGVTWEPLLSSSGGGAQQSTFNAKNAGRQGAFFLGMRSRF